MTLIETNLAQHVSYVHARTPGMIVHSTGGLLLADSRLPSDTFNKILHFSNAPAQALANAVQHFTRNARPFSLWTGPNSNLAAIPPHLRASESELGMIAHAGDLPPSPALPANLEIRPAITTAEIETFAAINAENWNPPDPAVAAFFRQATPLLSDPACPMRLFVAYHHGAPAAAGELFLSPGAAGIHMVSTRAAFRRRGIGHALTHHLALTGIRAGAPAAVLLASEMGAPVYARLGFKPVCRFTEYAPA